MKRFRLCMKAMKAMPVKAAAARPLKVALQKRDTPTRKESIVMVNGKYIAQCSITQSAKYKDIMIMIKKEIEDGTLKPYREAVRERIQFLISTD